LTNQTTYEIIRRRRILYLKYDNYNISVSVIVISKCWSYLRVCHSQGNSCESSSFQ